MDGTSFTFRPARLAVASGRSITDPTPDATDATGWIDDRVDGAPAWPSIGSDPTERRPEFVGEGAAWTCTIPAAGTRRYLCGGHHSTTGTIVVR